MKGLIWLGLIGMADPIRDGVAGLIETFHRAGIDTVMITGDQSATAYAIGKELNLSGESSWRSSIRPIFPTSTPR